MRGINGGLRRRRAPRRSKAVLSACPPQPPVRRLLPLAYAPPAGADEPPRSHSAWRPARRSWRVLRRGPGVTGGTRLTALFRPPVPLHLLTSSAADAHKRRKNICTNQETGAADVAQPPALVKGKTSACGALDKRGRLHAVVIRA